jgi:hypothetical protein
VLPTTDKICVLRHKDAKATAGGGKALEEDYEDLFLDVDFLRSVALVDTPGTNGLIEKHAKLTQEVIPRSDLVLFVTSGVCAVYLLCVYYCIYVYLGNHVCFPIYISPTNRNMTIYDLC